jgi:hypothetical protein
MPELHNIQAYLSLANRGFADAIDLFRQRLVQLGLATREIEAVFWSTADDGMSYSRHEDWQVVRLVGGSIDAIPYVLGWTPRVIPALNTNWLEVGFWLRSADISGSSPTDWRYLPDRVAALFELCAALLPLSLDAPIFLTDEAQDGKPWDAFVASEGAPWAFDLAIVSEAVRWPTAPLPDGFVAAPLSGGRAIARASIWPRLPWVRAA